MSTSQPSMQPTGSYIPSALSLNLRIGAVFIMFAASILGVLAPLYFFAGNESDHQKISDTENFRIMRSFAAGVMIGVAFIHLLSDADSRLNEIDLVANNYPPLAYTLATAGCLLVLGFEQVAVALIGGIQGSSDGHNHSEHNKVSNANIGCEAGGHEGICADLELEVVGSSRANESSNAVRVCEHHHAISMIAGAHGMNVIVKAYMMELSVAIHSIIIGVDLGSQAGETNLPALRALIIAISFHQFFEGLGLGSTLQEAKYQLGWLKVIIFSITFSLTVSIGIVIGILVTLEDGPATLTDSANYATGCLNALAAGILTYVALVEMIAEDFQAASIARNTVLKIKMFLALTLGTLFLAILAIWA
jgi:solute carrier family 39 (zinc transporter), member 1/2/3